MNKKEMRNRAKLEKDIQIYRQIDKQIDRQIDRWINIDRRRKKKENTYVYVTFGQRGKSN